MSLARWYTACMWDKPKTLPSQQELRAAFRYNGKHLLWRKKPRGARSWRAGHVRPDGYVAVGFQCSRYLVHRLIWVYVYGVEPRGVIDHVDNDPSNNRLENLRDVTQEFNCVRQWGRKKTTSRQRGVCQKRDGKWHVQFWENGTSKHYGRYTTEAEAIAVARRVLADKA